MKREGYWIAQCLEYDIVAQCPGTPDDIKNEFCRTMHVRVGACITEGIDPFALPKAPQMYHDLFKAGTPASGTGFGFSTVGSQSEPVPLYLTVRNEKVE